MKADEFRKLALSFPEATEQQHMNHPDFRVRGKVFATLTPDEKIGMVKLNPDQQRSVMRDEPDIFYPAAGMWGKRGATMVQLKNADETTILEALTFAWSNTAPKRLVVKYSGK